MQNLYASGNLWPILFYYFIFLLFKKKKKKKKDSARFIFEIAMLYKNTHLDTQTNAIFLVKLDNIMRTNMLRVEC
jgi:hypothetical protein